jgi:hypothetical protein
MYRTFLGCAIVALGAAAPAGGTEPQLPVGAAPSAVTSPHFPSRVHAFVWDWGWQGNGLAPETIARLPSSTWLMSVSE